MHTSTPLLRASLAIISHLRANNIEVILYGSLGVSVYLGNFKVFNDIDFLIDPIWIESKWAALQEVMSQKGFNLVDEHEHEFRDSKGTSVAFAANTILVRDDIVTTLTECKTVTIEGIAVHTLSPEAFKIAYEFSKRDGYRIETRGKKDQLVIDELSQYIDKHSQSI